MLREAHDEMKKNYYDPSLHGLNWQANHDKYSEKVAQITSLGQGFALVAGLLDGLNDSNTFFLPLSAPFALTRASN